MITEALPTSRRIIHKTSGHRGGPIARLMSPGDLGQLLKPFVFLDLFSAEARFVNQMPMHPHSGLATVTVLSEGDFHFDDPVSGTGTLGYGGVEWMRAGSGVWHGKEMSPGRSSSVTGFQLWLALPPELENGPVDSQYLESASMPMTGPATVIVGEYEGHASPVRAPAGITYLLVTLKPGEVWTYAVADDHGSAWLAVSHGGLVGDHPVNRGEMAIFDGEGAIRLEASAEGARFVIGSAVAHPHDLVTGSYSVHTSPAALAKGEARIRELHGRLPSANGSGSQPVFRG